MRSDGGAISRRKLPNKSYEDVMDESKCVGCGFCAGICPCGVCRGWRTCKE